MSRRLALGALTGSSVLILFSCLAGGRTAEIGFAVLAVAFPAMLMVVGAADSKGRLDAIAWPIGVVLLVLVACLFAMLAAVGRVETGAWILGLPAAAAVQLFGLFLLPFLVIAFGYALTFDRFGVGEDELERLRRLADGADEE